MKAVALSLMAGMIQLLIGLTKCGVVFDLVTPAVLTGFVSASAITIAAGQIKNVLGLPHVGRSFTDVVTGVVREIGHTQLWDTVLGVGCMLTVLALQHLGVRCGAWPAGTCTAFACRSLTAACANVNYSRALRRGSASAV